MTDAEFLTFYPQFLSVPEVVIREYVNQANIRFYDFADAAE